MRALGRDIVRLILLQHCDLHDAHSTLAVLCVDKWFSTLLTPLERAKLFFYYAHEKYVAFIITRMREGNRKVNPDLSWIQCTMCWEWISKSREIAHKQRCVAFSKPFPIYTKGGNHWSERYIHQQMCKCTLCHKKDTYPCFWRRIKHTGLMISCISCKRMVSVRGDKIAFGCLECGVVCVYCRKYYSTNIE
jgi:predicted RNA-binding Zn-ribbon protein involved in translation (DUF1610 family)